MWTDCAANGAPRAEMKHFRIDSPDKCAPWIGVQRRWIPPLRLRLTSSFYGSFRKISALNVLPNTLSLLGGLRVRQTISSRASARRAAGWLAGAGGRSGRQRSGLTCGTDEWMDARPPPGPSSPPSLRRFDWQLGNRLSDRSETLRRRQSARMCPRACWSQTAEVIVSCVCPRDPTHRPKCHQTPQGHQISASAL